MSVADQMSAFYAARDAGAPSLPSDRDNIPQFVAVNTPDEAKNPAWTDRQEVWAGCPFDGMEAFNASSAVGYIRGKAAKEKDLDRAADLNKMADLLSVTAKKVRARCERESMMAKAQA